MSEFSNKALSRVYLQYKNSPKLIKWLLTLPEIAQSNIVEQVEKIRRILDIDNAVGDQLDICGRIAGYRKRPSASVYPGCVFGPVNDELYRVLIKAKIYRNNSIATIDEVKTAADYILDAETRCLDGQDMTMRMIWFTHDVSIPVQQLVRDYDLIPRPQGVGTREHRVLTYKPFGFGPHYANFRAPFWHGDGLHLYYSVIFQFSLDNDLGILHGKLISEEVVISDLDVKLTITDENGEEKTVFVVADENGEFSVQMEKTGRYSVVGQTQIITPDCEQKVVTSKPFDFRWHIFVASLTTSVSSLEITRGDSAVFTVGILPENATNKEFSVELSESELADIKIDGDQVTITGLKKGAGEIVVTSLDTGLTATVALNVLPVRVESITVQPDTLRLIKDESVFVRVDTLPENADDRSWTVVDSDSGLVEVTVVEGGVQVTARDWGEADITLQTNDSGLRATIHVDVVDMAKFVMRIDSLDKALFSVAFNADDLTIDYGDGVDSADFRSEYTTGTNFSGYRIYATRALTVGSTYTLTVKGASAKSLTFYQGLSLFTVNALIELVKLSGTRSGIDHLARYYSPTLEKIHPDALDLPYCTTCDYAFSRSGLKAIPGDLLYRMPLLRTLASTFGECNAVPAIPPGLLDNNPLLTSLSGTFAYCAGVTVIPPDLLDNNPLVVTFDSTFRNSGVRAIPPGLFAGKSLVTTYSYTFYQCTDLESAPDGVFDDSPLNTNLSGVFYDDAALTGNLGDIFPLSQYAVTTLTSALSNCVGLTGSGVDFIGRMPLTSSHAAALRNCTGLDDYAQLRTDFPDWV